MALDLAPVPGGMGSETTEVAGADAAGDGDADEHDSSGVGVVGMDGVAPQGGLEPPAVGVEARCSSNRAATADGTAGRDRTGTLPVRTGMLVRSSCCGMASRGGLEPPTSGFGGRCSSDWATTTAGLEGRIRTCSLLVRSQASFR